MGGRHETTGLAGSYRFFLQETGSHREGMLAVTLRCAQQGPRCPAPGNADTKLSLEQKHQEPQPIGNISQNHGTGLTKLLGNGQSGREARTGEEECSGTLESAF